MPANRERGEVDIELGGRNYVLRADWEAMELMERDGSLKQFHGEYDGSPLLINSVKIGLRALLRHSNPNMSLDQAGKLLKSAPGENFMEQFKYVNERINEALVLAGIGKAKPKDGEELGTEKKEVTPAMEENGSSDPAAGELTGIGSSRLPTESSASVPMNSGH